ncbi:universal stress protein [Salinarchaeum sp. IM2453]|uniref:universal stress protein n=1 Tax=Salinarchaeum sp. IM2453 TaxID=2862870 RepID=UPI001C83E015|nr:universal stress protein [Salinarchaeum sp. IM2453]QZA89382.1 universal stress protein [Salinarchaeum sp. IM2453]
MHDAILVPTDGSPVMDTVVAYADQLAQQHGAVIHLLYVVDTGSFGGLPMEAALEDLTDQMHTEGKQALKTAQERVSGEAITQVTEGSPAAAITSYAENNNCDLIVMGTSGRTGLDRAMIGSVAERVVRNAPVPVITMRQDSETP